MSASPELLDELVLDLLAEAGEHGMSGEAIAQKLGAQAAEVFRGVARLQGRGYEISRRPGGGYCLCRLPDRLTALEVRRFLTTDEIGRRLHHHERLASTNQEALRLAAAGEPHGAVVVAEGQSEGRGRRGRGWHSPFAKNLYCSVILRPEVEAERLPELTFVASLALAVTLGEALGLDARIKWPNDVLVEGKKIAGILSEISSEGGQVAVVVGLGVNLNMQARELPEPLREIATSAAEQLGERVDRPLFLAALLSQLEAIYELWEPEGGWEGVRLRWAERSGTLGQRVRVELGDGQGVVEGVAEGLDERGGLIVRAGTQRRVIWSGDVSHLRPAEAGPGPS